MRLLLQQSAGHRVALAFVIENKAPRTARAIIEFEESTVGSEAAELARELLMGALQPDASVTDREASVAKVESFNAMARGLVLPLDSEALIEVVGATACSLLRTPR